MKTRCLFLVFPFVLFPVLSWSQLCQGSLGDPIVDITFGSGSSVHGGALSSSLTSYTYSSADFPMDGSYAIENSTAGSGSTWWSTTDHTGDAGGYMMVVNASISKTDYFYKNTITGLCPGTLYEFAAWVMNLLRSSDLNPPDITFLIEKTDGTILNSYTTGTIALQSGPVWRQFGFYFSTPAGVSTVVIRMRNNSAGGRPANDIALDDITFRPCGPTLSAWITGSATSGDTICAGSGTTLVLGSAISAGYTTPHCQWQEYVNGSWQDIAGDTTLKITVQSGALTAGAYRYRLAAGEAANFAYQQCRVVSNEVTLVVEPRPVAGYGLVSSTVCENEPVTFIDSTQSLAPLSCKWDFGDGTTSSEANPSHLYAHSGIYHTRLVVTSSHGCSDTAYRDVTIQLLPLPVAAFTVSPTDTSIFHPTVFFTDGSTGATDCHIDWGDGTVTGCDSTQHNYRDPGTYIIMEIVMNAIGCSDTAFSRVLIRPEYRFFIPNAFTPNGDGLNDLFRPVLFGVYNYSFWIFNRIGQQLYETHDSEAGWDGTFRGEACPEDYYVYKISLNDEVENRPKTYTGAFLLLRK